MSVLTVGRAATRHVGPEPVETERPSRVGSEVNAPLTEEEGNHRGRLFTVCPSARSGTRGPTRMGFLHFSPSGRVEDEDVETKDSKQYGARSTYCTHSEADGPER